MTEESQTTAAAPELTAWAKQHKRATRFIVRAMVVSSSVTIWLFWTACVFATFSTWPIVDPYVLIFDLGSAGMVWAFTRLFYEPYIEAKASGVPYPC
jgi:uncharacterized membrane protein